MKPFLLSIFTSFACLAAYAPQKSEQIVSLTTAPKVAWNQVAAVDDIFGDVVEAPTPARVNEAADLENHLARDEKILQDWANLSRYRDENTLVKPPSESEDRVVFMGDSIMDFWGRQRGKFFPGKSYLNRGISGQTTPQMLIRLGRM